MQKVLSWAQRLNALGSRREPFLFILDFEGRQPLLYRWQDIDARELRFDFHGVGNELELTGGADFSAARFEPHFVDPAVYRTAFTRVQQGLQRGDSFLTNLVFPTPITTELTLEQVFSATRARYRLYLRDRFVCFSPEIFVRIDPAGVTGAVPFIGLLEIRPAGSIRRGVFPATR